MLGCRGRTRSQRDLAGLTGSSPAFRSMPPAGMERASLIRMPVTAISPNSAVQVADRNAGRMLLQAAVIRVMSSSEKINGAGRLPCPGKTPLGGISVAGSVRRSQAATPGPR